jgi:hypothetical protein
MDRRCKARCAGASKMGVSAQSAHEELFTCPTFREPDDLDQDLAELDQDTPTPFLAVPIN